MANISMTSMQREVGTNKIKSRRYPQKKINLSGIGSGPDVKFFDRLDTVAAGETFRLNTPTVGPNWVAYGANYKYMNYGGRRWIPLRDPDNVSSATQFKNEVRFDIGETLNNFYISVRMVADPALIFPYALGANQGWDTPNLKSHKPFWMGDFANASPGGSPDLVINNIDGTGLDTFGNTTKPTSVTPVANTLTYQNNLYFDTSGASTKVSFYQSGDESSPGAKDATMILTRTDVNGTVAKTYIGDPYNPNGETPAYRYYDGQFIVNGQITSPVTGYVNVQHGQSDFYVAKGANCRARVIASSSPTYAGDTVGYDIAPDYWSNANSLIAFTPTPYEHALGYYHVILGDGTVINNVTVVDA